MSAFVGYMESLMGECKWNTSYTEAHFCCPFCTSRGETEDTRWRFRFNAKKLVGVCYNCGWGGSAVHFVKDYQRLSWADALDIVNFYTDFVPLPQDVFDEVFDKIFLEGEYEVEKHYIPPPKDFKLLAGTSSILADRYYKYAKSRKLTDKQIELHGCGFCPEGELILPDKRTLNLDNRLFIQVFDDDNKPQYWMARALDKDLKPKTFNPVGGANTINKSDVVFNLNNAKKTGVAVITEGVFDATTVGASGVALFGKTMSVKQLLKLVQADLEAVYVMLDNDAMKDALKVADQLHKYIDNTYLCMLPKGLDPNDAGRKGCLEVIKNAEKYDKLTALKYKLLN